MKRTNTFKVRLRSATDEEVLRRLLDAPPVSGNELTDERRQRYFAAENVWDADSH